MVLSDISIHRPVFATVVSLLLIVLGVISFTRLPLRELPDIDPPVVSISTTYEGASAEVIESQITQVMEGAVRRATARCAATSAISLQKEGVPSVTSTSTPLWPGWAARCVRRYANAPCTAGLMGVPPSV